MFLDYSITNKILSYNANSMFHSGPFPDMENIYSSVSIEMPSFIKSKEQNDEDYQIFQSSFPRLDEWLTLICLIHTLQMNKIKDPQIQKVLFNILEKEDLKVEENYKCYCDLCMVEELHQEVKEELKALKKAEKKIDEELEALKAATKTRGDKIKKLEEKLKKVGK